MKNDLKVVTQFFPMDLGDMFKYDDKSDSYTCNYSQNSDDSSYNLSYTISCDLAKRLLEQGFLVEVKNNNADEAAVKDNSEARAKYYQQKYVNLREHIDKLHTKYVKAIANPNNGDQPKCLQVEQETVLKNLEKLTKHLLEYGK